MGDRTEDFRLRFNKLHKIGNGFLEEQDDKLRFALCQSEIVKSSSKLIDLINKVSDNEYDCSEESLDRLLEELVEIRLLLYYEMVPWMRKFRIPLNNAINAVEKQLCENEDGN